MGREAAADEVETFVGERKGARLGFRRFDVAELARCRELCRLGQHLIGDVARRDLGDMRSKRGGHVPGSGCNVEYEPILLRCSKLYDPRQAFAFGVNVRGGVVACGDAEL